LKEEDVCIYLGNGRRDLVVVYEEFIVHDMKDSTPWDEDYL
jgi:hypothetical protein